MHYFIDVDGVLNKESDWRKPFTLNDECVENFMELISKDKDPHIILSSTWRQGFTNTGVQSARADGLTEKLASLGIAIEDSTPVSNKSRQEEIEYYIRRNGVKKYLVLDDDRSLFPRPKEIRIYFTNYKTGLTGKDVKAILKQGKVPLSIPL